MWLQPQPTLQQLLGHKQRQNRLVHYSRQSRCLVLRVCGCAPLQVSLSERGARCCKVMSVSPASLAGDPPPADLQVLAPVLVTAPGTLQRHVAVALDIAAASCADIHATSHAAIAAAAAEVAADYSPEACAAADAAVAAAHPGLWQLLGAAVGAAAAGGHPVWHLPLDFFFCVAEQQEYDQVAAFFAEYLQAQGRLRQKVGSGSTRVGCYCRRCVHRCWVGRSASCKETMVQDAEPSAHTLTLCCWWTCVG